MSHTCSQARCLGDLSFDEFLKVGLPSSDSEEEMTVDTPPRRATQARCTCINIAIPHHSLGLTSHCRLSKHKADLSRLASTDPEFYQFLQVPTLQPHIDLNHTCPLLRLFWRQTVGHNSSNVLCILWYSLCVCVHVLPNYLTSLPTSPTTDSPPHEL